MPGLYYYPCSPFYENNKRNQKERIGSSLFSGYELILLHVPPYHWMKETSMRPSEANHPLCALDSIFSPLLKGKFR